MDYAFQGRHPPNELAALVAHLNEDFGTQKWLADSGANVHITAEAANIQDPQPFEGTDVVGVGNGAGLNIQHFGYSIVQSSLPNCPQLLLKDVLHCPKASANLLSINKFCIDNNCWFALTGSNFLVKDNLTGMVLLQGPSENGLYPIPLHHLSLNKWKGFAAYLPLTGSLDKTRICEACQLGKSKKLPFGESTRCTSNPLELIHSDV